MKKLVAVLTVIAMLATLMFAEYRYIMYNLRPCYAENGFIYIEFMGQTDIYCAELIFVQED